MTDSSESPYTKLTQANSFRILELQNGSGSDELVGILYQTVTLDMSVDYEALSYRWSKVEPHNPSIIKLNGAKLAIGSGLHAALCQFRHQAMPRWLWIDQICIDQQNTDEIMSQLDIMDQIYKKAQKVLIWLGEARDQSDIAMEFLPIFVERVQREVEQSAPLPSKIIPWKGALATLLSDLLSRDWFGRVWTLQEAAMAQTAEVWCGQKSFPFAVLEMFEEGCKHDNSGHWAAALSLIGSKRPDPENPDRSFTNHIHLVSSLRAPGRKVSARILNSLRSLDCTQHQDRVFSVLRFLDPELRDEITRMKDLSPTNLYHHAAMYELQRGELEYLGAAGLSQQRAAYPPLGDDLSRPLLCLPSWVPDWTYKIRAHSYWVHNSDHVQKRGEPLYTAGLKDSTRLGWSVSGDGKLLLGRCVILDEEVSEITAPFRVMRVPENQEDDQAKASTVQISPRELLSFIDTCLELASKCVSRYGSQSVTIACRRSLVGNLMPDGPSTTMTGTLVRASDQAIDSMFEAFQEFASVFEEMRTVSQAFRGGTTITDMDLKRSHTLTEKMQSLPPLSSTNNLLQAVAEACKGRRFFITSPGRYMGVAPDLTQIGDKICVIPGCCAPFVLRAKGEHYQLIGETYVEGMMDGELLKTEEVCLKPISFT